MQARRFAALALIAGLAACDQTSPSPPTLPAPSPAPPPGVPAPPAPPAPGQPPAPAEEPVSDGGAELPSDEPAPTEVAASGEAPDPTPPPPADFPHDPPGALQPGTGSGYADRTLWSEAMCFPLEEAGYLNSQVWGPGGGHAPPGKPSQCDASNYSFPWRDTFCESRSRDNPLCGNGQGHQGQDMRPATCVKNVHWAVAAENGVITDIGGYSVTLTASASPHRIYRYLHMQPTTLAVAEGASVVMGQRLGKVSNAFDNTPTTIHLHFEVRVSAAEALPGGGFLAAKAFVPPYTSLVAAYARKQAAGGGPGCG